MAKKYTGSLTLEWYNKQKAILLQSQEQAGPKDIPAPRINWINKEEALFYEIDEKEGKGLVPYWVDRNDIRVKEARPLIFQKAYKAVPKNKKGSLPGTEQEWKVEDLDTDDPEIENILIKGDNLLALNTIKKLFENKPEEEKVKCIYIDPPYNTGSAFQQYDDNLAHSEWLTLMRDRFLILKQLLRRSGVIFVQLDEKEYSYCRLLLDEIFGFSNFVGDLIWQKRKGGGNDSRFVALDHDYIAIYVLNSNLENHPDKWRIAYEEE
jgi:adenine-specific DNA-methyltransferase